MLRYSVSLTLFLAVCLPVGVHAQSVLPGERWFALKTENFDLLSQVSEARTESLARDLEAWRQVAARYLAETGELARAAVPNQVYVFEDAEALARFSPAGEPGLFFATPRRNFMALVYDDPDSLREARHHYLHFLVRNHVDLSIPRWYEEGLAGYLDGLEIDGEDVEPERFLDSAFSTMLQLNREVSMEELLYDEDALASPRLIQIANFKSEVLLHFMFHGWEEGFPDLRIALQNYLDLSLQGRTQRYAFDQSFALSPSALDNEFERYLRDSSRPSVVPKPGTLQLAGQLDSEPVDETTVAVALAELALHAGHFVPAQELFELAIGAANSPARAFSGMADALRMQELPEQDAGLAEHYRRALELGPTDPLILLDFGEYLESLAEDCDRPLTEAELTQIKPQIREFFDRALALDPEHPESNLAMAQFYLLDGEDVNLGVPFQRKAMALLPADSFVMEQAVKYAIAEQRLADAERLIQELSQPLHFWGEPEWVSDLRERLVMQQRGQDHDRCAD